MRAMNLELLNKFLQVTLNKTQHKVVVEFKGVSNLLVICAYYWAKLTYLDNFSYLHLTDFFQKWKNLSKKIC